MTNSDLEIEQLREAVRIMLPMIQEAFYDHHGAGTCPGSGYNHRVYAMISSKWGWRDDRSFKAFTDTLKEIIGK